MFKDDLRKKDDDYRKMLKDQGEDVELMINNMRQQFYQLRDMYLGELNEIENKYDQDVIPKTVFFLLKIL